MENRIKECQLDLFADRTSAATMRANQLRLWFASMAYVLLCALRRIGLAHTQFAAATCGTIRLALLKIGALVQIQRPAHSPRHGIGLPVAERVPIGPPTARGGRPLTNQKPQALYPRIVAQPATAQPRLNMLKIPIPRPPNPVYKSDPPENPPAVAGR